MDSTIRILVADDSSFIRHAIMTCIELDPHLAVAGSAIDGMDALNKVKELAPDIVILDGDMPRMDGLTTLRHIMVEHPTPVIMFSDLIQPGTRAAVDALAWGAVDYVSKPAGSVNLLTAVQELIRQVKRVAEAQPTVHPITPAQPSDSSDPSSKSELRPFHRGDPLIIIGASAGGPRAVQQVLGGLPPDLPAAVAVIQHMPPGFTQSLAQRLHRHTPLTVREAAQDDRLAQSQVLIAPGDYHLRFIGGERVTLDRGPRRHHVRPAVDVSMESAAEHHGPAVIGVVLTGMGSDGTFGAQNVKTVGGRVIVEDESTSMLYGMPRSVIEANLADQVVPLPEIAPALMEMVNYEHARI